MTIDKKIEYAQARAQGAQLFAQDCGESKSWQKAIDELQAEKAVEIEAGAMTNNLKGVE